MTQDPVQRRWRLVAGALALVPALALAGPGEAHPRHEGPGHGSGPGMMDDIVQHMKYRLELTEGQEQQMHQLMKGRHERFTALHEEMSGARLALFDAIHAETIDETAIRSAAAAVGAIDAEFAVARAGLFQQVRGVLTPDQRVEAIEMIGEMRAFHADHPGAVPERGGHFGHRPGR